jgi:hypothetical protein
VKIHGGFCFSCSHVEHVTFGSECEVARIEEECFGDCPGLKSICVPRSVELLGKSCFIRSSVETLIFESQSRLRRIDETCFGFCKSLKSIVLPASVNTIDGSAFHDSSIETVEVEVCNHELKIEEQFLMNFVDSIAIRYLGIDLSIEIPSWAKIHGRFCF